MLNSQKLRKLNNSFYASIKGVCKARTYVLNVLDFPLLRKLSYFFLISVLLL